MFKSKKDLVFITLAGFFITNAVVAELIGGKLIQVNLFDIPFIFKFRKFFPKHINEALFHFFCCLF
jgi:hypothetical protein